MVLLTGELKAKAQEEYAKHVKEYMMAKVKKTVKEVIVTVDVPADIYDDISEDNWEKYQKAVEGAEKLMKLNKHLESLPMVDMPAFDKLMKEKMEYYTKQWGIPPSYFYVGGGPHLFKNKGFDIGDLQEKVVPITPPTVTKEQAKEMQDKMQKTLESMQAAMLACEKITGEKIADNILRLLDIADDKEMSLGVVSIYRRYNELARGLRESVQHTLDGMKPDGATVQVVLYDVYYDDVDKPTKARVYCHYRGVTGLATMLWKYALVIRLKDNPEMGYHRTVTQTDLSGDFALVVNKIAQDAIDYFGKELNKQKLPLPGWYYAPGVSV